MWTIHSLFQKIAYILFPKACYSCRKEGFSLCASCLVRCRQPIDTPYIYITSVYSFKDPLIKRAIHAIKYYHRKDLVEPLAEGIVQTIKKDSNYDLTKDQWILVPVPMPQLRKYMRGYNQAELIAQELARKLSLPLRKDLIVRVRTPKRQVMTKSRSERLKNQHASFKVTGDIGGLYILLVDDVTTTGATLHEQRKILLKAGAKNVRAVTIAH